VGNAVGHEVTAFFRTGISHGSVEILFKSKLGSNNDDHLKNKNRLKCKRRGGGEKGESSSDTHWTKFIYTPEVTRGQRSCKANLVVVKRGADASVCP
jgi:hypothetical protein